MIYIREEAEVIYRSKDGKEEKVFDVARMACCSVLSYARQGRALVRYYGHYSNMARSKGEKVKPS